MKTIECAFFLLFFLSFGVCSTARQVYGLWVFVCCAEALTTGYSRLTAVAFCSTNEKLVQSRFFCPTHSSVAYWIHLTWAESCLWKLWNDIYVIASKILFTTWMGPFCTNPLNENVFPLFLIIFSFLHFSLLHSVNCRTKVQLMKMPTMKMWKRIDCVAIWCTKNRRSFAVEMSLHPHSMKCQRLTIIIIIRMLRFESDRELWSRKKIKKVV